MKLIFTPGVVPLCRQAYVTYTTAFSFTCRFFIKTGRGDDTLPPPVPWGFIQSLPVPGKAQRLKNEVRQHTPPACGLVPESAAMDPPLPPIMGQRLWNPPPSHYGSAAMVLPPSHYGSVAMELPSHTHTLWVSGYGPQLWVRDYGPPLWVTSYGPSIMGQQL